jgi:2-hydroxymuconate-semialdehyde hydrolase
VTAPAPVRLVTAPALSTGRVDVAGVSTAVIDTGTPEGAVAPPVLLLHGSGPGVTATANWRPIIPAVSASRRVIAPDQLGFGATATGEQRTYGRTAWTDHALALLDTLGIGAVDVIGNSMGGAIALSIAAARPDAVRRMVLMGSMGVAMALPHGLNAVWGYTPGMEQMRQVFGLFAHNRVVPWRSSSAQLLDLLPDARLHVLSGCGHWAMIERTADFLAVVQPFLAA